MIVAAANGSDVDLMNCMGDECDLPLQLFATQVPFQAGMDLRHQALLAGPGKLRICFQEQPAGGYFVAIDELGDMQEVRM